LAGEHFFRSSDGIDRSRAVDDALVVVDELLAEVGLSISTGAAELHGRIWRFECDVTERVATFFNVNGGSDVLPILSDQFDAGGAGAFNIPACLVSHVGNHPLGEKVRGGISRNGDFVDVGKCLKSEGLIKKISEGGAEGVSARPTCHRR